MNRTKNGEPIAYGEYQHFKKKPGALYVLHDTSIHRSEGPLEGKTMVHYRPLQEDFEWATRTYDDFFEHVDKPEYGHSGPRFTLVRELTKEEACALAKAAAR